MCDFLFFKFIDLDNLNKCLLKKKFFFVCIEGRFFLLFLDCNLLKLLFILLKVEFFLFDIYCIFVIFLKLFKLVKVFSDFLNKIENVVLFFFL